MSTLLHTTKQMIKHKKYALASSLFAGSLLLSSASFALTPFTASYDFNLDNKASGTATRVLAKKTEQQWSYQFTAKVPVIASASESSVFSLDNQQNITSQGYSRQYKILGISQNSSISFNPATKLINTSKDKTKRQFAWKPGVLDDLNAELQVREDLKKGKLQASYPIADQKDVTDRQFVNEGNMKVTVPAGTYDTVKVRLKHSKNDKNTIFWLAPSLDYLPVQMSHEDNGSIYTLKLKNYSPK